MSTTRIRPRTLAVLAAFAGLIAVVAVTIPSSGAAAPGFVRLNLGSDGNYFEYGTTRQNLTVAKNGCQITSAEPVIDLSATGTSQSQPGLADGLGVKYSNSSGNGTPCSQTDTLEELILKPGSGLGGRRFSAVRLDLEMTGNALVQLTFSSGGVALDTYTLQTGTSITEEESGESDYDMTAPYFVSSSGPDDTVDACASPNSSGPNSAGNDNCQWTVVPGDDFDTVTLSTTVGTVSLEGGNDFPSNEDMDSLFYLANSAPLAVNDSYATNEDTALTTGDVTDNDSDPDGDALQATVVGAPSHGTVTLASNGSFTYTPDSNYNGPDTFTYNLSDGTMTSNTATVSITVLAVNDIPVATGDGAEIDEDESGTVVVATDVDEGDVLTVDCDDPDGDEPDGWTVRDLGGGAVEITPPANFVGILTIDCTVTDAAGATTLVPVTIDVDVNNVNDAPVAVDDEADFNPDDGTSVDIDVLANDGDIDSSSLTAGNFTYPNGGSATFTDGIVRYTPPVEITAPVSFTYQAYDGDLYSNVATVTVYPVICRLDTVTDSDGAVTGSFTRLDDPNECKRYTLEASDADGTILFQLSGTSTVTYRGEVSFGSEPVPAPGDPVELGLWYDETGGFDFEPMQWCLNPQFDGDDVVTSATLPTGETWCIASAYTRGAASGDVLTVYQVYGVDDPRMTR